MVQVETSQLASECNSWRETLRKYRDEFTQDNIRLQLAAKPSLSKDQLQQVEHLHNQFHIQLINIHDIKQFIKAHVRKIDIESSSGESVSDETFTEHEELLDQFLSLESTFQELRNDFKNFTSAASC